MSDDYKSYYRWLNEQDLFRSLAEHVARQKPELPTFNAEKDNTDEWKRKSGMQDGFDLAFSLLTGYTPNDYLGD